MPKVLVIGATGYIGRALALSLVRSGNHTVYGLARSAAKARALAAEEITPVLGSATDSAAYISLIHSAHIDIVVDAAGTLSGGLQIVSDVRAAGAERLKRAAAVGVLHGGPRLAFIYTSGAWVHGETRLPGHEVNDLDYVAVEGAVLPPPWLAWRTEIEGKVMEAGDVLDVAIARPGVVYGGSSWIFDTHFEVLRQAVEDLGADGHQRETVTLAADQHARFGAVHVEDVGAGLHLIVDRVAGLGFSGVWPVFDFVGSVESMGTVLTLAAKSMGFKGRLDFVIPTEDVIAAALSMGQSTSSGRAKSILGWIPRKPGMLAQIEVYTQAWRAVKAQTRSSE